VHLLDGALVKATGASLSGLRAALSALTETPFPFPGTEASAPGPDGLPVRMLEDLPESGLKALILPFALRQDIAVRKDVGREMADIFRLAWLNRRVFEVMEYDPSRPWPGRAEAMAQAKAKGANILVSGNHPE